MSSNPLLPTNNHNPPYIPYAPPKNTRQVNWSNNANAYDHPLNRQSPEHHIPVSSTPPPRGISKFNRSKSVRHVKLTQGNLVLDCPVPDKLLRNVKYSTGEEFTQMRYTAVTCDPNEFVKNRYTLRPYLYNRQTELFIVMTMYNEDDQLFLATMNSVIKNIAHLCSRSKSKMWGPEGWKKVVVCVVSDGRLKIHQRVLKVLGAMGVYQEGIAKTTVGDKAVTAHVYEYTSQVVVDRDTGKLGGSDKGTVPIQILFCLKEKNAKKLNSHRWFFRAFAPVLNPNVCILLDVGTKPSGTSLYHLWKAFDRSKYIGGACGEICAEVGHRSRNLLNPLVASQNFEYKMSNILDKPLESVFGYISVLPGAFSAYRYKALKDTAPGIGPLSSYFKGETLHGDALNAGIFEANMYLAEDRILCFELVAKRGEQWLLKYVKAAKAETDVPDNLSEFISQRRRWLNGSFFASFYATFHFWRIWTSGQSIFRKFFLMFLFLYNLVNLVFNWFALGNFYLTFFFLTKASVPTKIEEMVNGTLTEVVQKTTAPDPFFGQGDVIFNVLREAYIMVIIIIVISALGNRPQGSKFIYMTCVFIFAILMLVMLYVAVFTIYQTVPKTAQGWENVGSLLQTSPAFRDIIISLGSTYILYFVSSFMYGEPAHMFTSFIQYLLLLPSYVNILMVYAFCNTHDVSWGTKGDNTAESLGAAQVSANKEGHQIVKVEVPTEKDDINERYEDFLRTLAVPEVKQKSSRDAKTKMEDYYRLFRTRLVLCWMFSNALLIVAMSSSAFIQYMETHNPSPDQAYNPYLTFIFWSVAGLSSVRFTELRKSPRTKQANKHWLDHFSTARHTLLNAMQHSRAVVLLVLLACICQRVASLAINVQADTQECFFEDLDVGDKMTVTFQVGDGGNLDIDFWISDPAERVIKSGIRETTGTHEVIANLKGRYTYCFSNRMSSVSDKSVSFNVHDVQKQGADSVNVDPLEREIRELAESMSAVKDEQEYIVIRERQHRDTAESTNARVKWWSLGQLGLLVGVCFWQIFYLKRFFEVKRVV